MKSLSVLSEKADIADTREGGGGDHRGKAAKEDALLRTESLGREQGRF